MYNREIELRKSLGYPPFSRIINIKIEGKLEENVRDAAARLTTMARKFQNRSEPEILGPAPAPLTRIRDRYRWQILLKGEKIDFLHGFLNNLAGEIPGLTKGGKVKISFDVDPEYMM
jgi:primosomal protein N' (replication factor Y)